MGTTTGYVFFGACAIAWVSIAHNRGQAMRVKSRRAAEMFWYAGGGIPLVVATLFLVHQGGIDVWLSRLMLGVFGAVIGAMLLVGVGEIARPSVTIAQESGDVPVKDNQTPPVMINGGDNVVSIGQIGGITAKVVNINPPPPAPELQVLSRIDAVNPDGSYTTNISTQVASPITPGLLVINIAADGLLGVSITPPPVDGVSAMSLRNVRRSDNAYSAEIPSPRGQYDITVRTRSKADITLNAMF